MKCQINMAKYKKNEEIWHFFAKIFCHMKKKLYLCTLFRRASEKIRAYVYKINSGTRPISDGILS